MKHETSIPALVPFLTFATALLLAPRLVNPEGAIAAGCAIALLAAASPRSRRFLTAAVALSAGLMIGHLHGASRAREAAAVASLPLDRFAVIEAAVDDDWQRNATGEMRLEARRFRVTSGDSMFLVEQPIAFYLASDAPPPLDASSIRVEASLRRSTTGRFYASIKSARLISFSGEIRRWHPRWWNRTLDRKLRAIGAERPELAEATALARALALGRSDELSDDTRESYRRGGTYHLLVFSGMQIAAAAAAIVALLRIFHRPRIADWTLALLAALAPAFAGDEPSVARASWMIGVFAATRIAHRPTPLANLLFVSAILRLAFHPEEISHAGFALTYGATAGLILLGPRLARLIGARRASARAVAYSVGAELGTNALTLGWFNQYVVGGSIVTLVIAPLLTLMLAFSAIAAAAAVAKPEWAVMPLQGIAWLDRIATAANAVTADTLHLHGYAPAPAKLLLLAAWGIALAAIAWLPRNTATFVAIAALLSPAAASWWTLHSRAEAAAPSVEILDVGQGDATLVRYARNAILVDGGGSLRDPRFGSRVLIPALVTRGVRRLDAVVLTHPHPDHCVGLIPVMQSLEVGELWISGRHAGESCTARLVDIAFLRGIPVRIAERATPVAIGSIALEPMVPRLRFKRAFLNNTSIVLRVRFGRQSALLTGDIEKDAERTLVEDFGPRLDTDVLKVAHHGSRTSTTSRFLDATSPATAVISCGRDNRFGHPAADVVEELRRRRIRVFRTDRDGSVRLTFRETRVAVGN